MSNSECASIAIETLKIAQGLANLQQTKEAIGKAIEWAENMAKMEVMIKKAFDDIDLQLDKSE